MNFSRVLAALVWESSTADSIVIWQIRLPRAISALLVGMALGASGAALQGLLRNPLAEPGVLGVTASASLSATFSLYYGLITTSPFLLPIYSIIGALVATGLLVIAATRVRSVVTLILIGVGLSSFSAALMSLMLNLAPNPFSLADMINWLLGSVANRSFDDILIITPFMLTGFLILFFSKRGLSVLTLGEEAAAGIGLNLYRLRIAIILGTGLVTGASVALAGAIGFIGIVAPHLMRPLVHHNPSKSIVPSALLGGIILIIADIIIRLLPTSSEIKLGVIAAIIGAPAFIWIAMKRRLTHD
tara:strand:+ start:1113 stop:2018 length:906 start_codon:yes stop_codon:yes gene_type:complete